jgi:hypothetical protein
MQVLEPEKPVSLLFDACVAINKLCGHTGYGCGGLGWERTYISNKKYMCQEDNSWLCNNEVYHFCPYWSCVSWATWHRATHLDLFQKGTTTPNCSQTKLNSSHLIGHRDRLFFAIGGFKTPVEAVGLNDAMKIQTLKPGKCSLTLDASRIIQGTQQTDFPPDATTTFSQQLALCANEAWDKLSASTLGDLTNFQIPAKPPLMMPPLSTKQLGRSVSIIPIKGWNVRSLAFLEWVKGPEVIP